MAVHVGFFRPGGEEYALAERYLRLGHHHQRPRHRYQGELVSEYLAKGPSSMSRSWQGSRLIEEEMRRGGHRPLRGRPVCVTSTGAGVAGRCCWSLPAGAPSGGTVVARPGRVDESYGGAESVIPVWARLAAWMLPSCYCA